MTATTDHSAATPAGPIRRLTPGQRAAALERLALRGGKADAQQVQRFVDFARKQGIDLTDFWGWIGPAGTLDHVALIIPRPGQTGMCFVSRPYRRGHVEHLAAVIRAAAADVLGERLTLLQSLIETTDDLQQAALTSAGFAELAVLGYMQRAIARSEPEPAPRADVQLKVWDESLREQFVAALDASYEQTLDCPALHGIRRTEDVLAGHMATGRFDAPLWTLACVDGQPAAVLLLADVPEQDCVELVYLGVGSGFREKGLGRYLMQRAIAQTSQRRVRAMTLAVDQRNEPAMGLYHGVGFRRFARRIAMALSAKAMRDAASRDEQR